ARGISLSLETPSCQALRPAHTLVLPGKQSPACRKQQCQGCGCQACKDPLPSDGLEPEGPRRHSASACGEEPLELFGPE
ncbi:unnamed protein product, partial [Bubo scandiacus]